MTTLRIELIDRQFADHLKQLAARLGHLRPVFDEIGAVIESRTKERIDTFKADPSGQPWKDWEPATARQAARQGQSQAENLLLRTGRMFRELTHTATDDAALVGFGVPYAISHELGADIRMGARSQRATFRVDMKSGRSRFAKRKNANFEQWIAIPEHTVHIPPRRMLTKDGRDLGDGDKQAVLGVLARYLTPP